MTDSWVWDADLGVYYNAPSNTYARLADGAWTYIPASEFSTLEDGEIADDVGWGALMEDVPETRSNDPLPLRLVVTHSSLYDLGPSPSSTPARTASRSDGTSNRVIIV